MESGNDVLAAELKSLYDKEFSFDILYMKKVKDNLDKDEFVRKTIFLAGAKDFGDLVYVLFGFKQHVNESQDETYNKYKVAFERNKARLQIFLPGERGEQTLKDFETMINQIYYYDDEFVQRGDWRADDKERSKNFIEKLWTETRDAIYNAAVLAFVAKFYYADTEKIVVQLEERMPRMKGNEQVRAKIILAANASENIDKDLLYANFVLLMSSVDERELKESKEKQELEDLERREQELTKQLTEVRRQLQNKRRRISEKVCWQCGGNPKYRECGTDRIYCSGECQREFLYYC